MTRTPFGRAGKALARRTRMVPGAFSAEQWNAAAERHANALGAYRVPMQVCPRGCEYREVARRDLLTRTRASGRVDVHTEFRFETRNCPKCGALLTRQCTRCRREILAPVADRCRFCGLPQPWAQERRAGVERSAIRRWRPGEDGVNDPASLLFENKRGEIWVLEGDVTHVKVDAVVSNDDVDGQMWSEVARAIKTAAGEHVERRAQDDAPYRIGDAWLTEPGDLAVKGIIHVALMSRHGGSGVEVVSECIVAALDLAAQQGYDSLAVGAIGSGPNAIDLDVWLDAFIETTVGYLTDMPGSPNARMHRISVLLVLFEPDDYGAALRALTGAVARARADFVRAGGTRRRVTLARVAALWRRLRSLGRRARRFALPRSG